MSTTRFITDLGPGPHTLTNETTGEVTTLARYGVWGSAVAYRKAEVIEIGSDLEALQAKYGPDLPIFPYGGGSTSG